VHLIVDVLKATMAVPTYFPPQHMHKQIIQDGRFVKDPDSDHKPAEICFSMFSMVTHVFLFSDIFL
jgi:hypothetical protein